MPIPSGGSPGGIDEDLSVEVPAAPMWLIRSKAASGNAYRSALATRVLAKRTSVITRRVDLCGGHAVSVCFKGGLT